MKEGCFPGTVNSIYKASMVGGSVIQVRKYRKPVTKAFGMRWG